MNVTLHMMMDRLNHHDCELIKGERKNAGFINEVMVLDGNDRNFETDVLYVMKDVSLIAKLDGYLPRNILCIPDNVDVPSGLITHGYDYIVVKGEADPESITQYLRGVLLEYKKWSDSLLRALIEGADTKKMVNLGAEFLGNPIKLMNLGFKTLAYSTDDEDMGFIWVTSVKKGYLELHGVEAEESKRHLSLARKHTSPFMFRSGTLPYPFLSSNVVSENKTIALIIMVEKNKPITKSDFRSFQFLGQMLALQLQKHELVRQNIGVQYEYLLLDLLEGKLVKLHELECRMQCLEWDFQSDYFAFVIKASKYYINNEHLMRIQKQCMSYITQGLSIIYEDNIVIVMKRTMETYFNESQMQLVKEFLKSNDVYGGLSRFSRNLLDLQLYYRQALKAIEIGTHVDVSDILHYYSEYGIYDMVDICSLHSDISNFYYSSIEKLIQYDKQYKTNFADTLKKYINNRNNQYGTAKALNIHRNTLLYRINKIQEIMDADLNNHLVSLHIQLTFFMMDYTAIRQKTKGAYIKP